MFEYPCFLLRDCFPSHTLDYVLRQRRKRLRCWRRKRLRSKCAKLPTIPPLAIPTLNGNLRGVYGTFCTCTPHIYGATRAHSATPFLEPLPSLAGSTRRCLTTLCPHSPFLAYPYLPTHSSFPLGGYANVVPGLSLFHCSVRWEPSPTAAFGPQDVHKGGGGVGTRPRY